MSPSNRRMNRQPRIITTVSPARTLTDSTSANTTSSIYNGLKLSTVPPSLKDESHTGVDLYAWQLRATHFPLYKQLQTARKTLTTHDWMLARDELKSVKTIQKIEALKKKNLWSMRQLKRHKAPPRAKTHWDSMLDEMKWMQTDFKQERKWKIALAYNISKAIMEWHHAEDKSTVCVRTRIPDPISPPSLPVFMEEDPQSITPNNAPLEEEMTEALADSTMTSQPVDEHQSLVENTIETTSTEEPLKNDAMMGTDTVDPILNTERDTTQSVDLNNTPFAMDTADESSMPTTPNFNTESLSSDIIQEYRNIMKDFDPNMSILTLSVEDFGEFDAGSLFPDILTYEPPNPNFNDLYFNELEYGKIVPLTKLIAQQITLKAPKRYSRKRTIDGHPIIYDDEVKDYKSEIKTLPRHERYDPTPLISRKYYKDACLFFSG